MRKRTLQTLSVICGLSFFAAASYAQRGGGGQGRVDMQGGGCMKSGGNAGAGSGMMAGQGFRMGGGMTGNMMNANLMNAFANMNRLGPSPMSGNNGDQGSRDAASNRQPTPQQFTQTAMRMDRDRDRKLNREELAEVATAVMAELNRHSQNRIGAPPVSFGSDRTTAFVTGDSTSNDSEMTESFVNRCLQFDVDKDCALNVTETRVMAAALIKSLS